MLLKYLVNVCECNLYAQDYVNCGQNVQDILRTFLRCIHICLGDA